MSDMRNSDHGTAISAWLAGMSSLLAQDAKNTSQALPGKTLNRGVHYEL